MRFPRFLGAGVTLLVLAASGWAQTFIWTGVGTGWQGQGFPPNDGSATLVYQNGVRHYVNLYGDTYLNAITLVGDDDLYFVPHYSATTPITVTLSNGVNFAASGDPDADAGRYDFGPDINIAVAGPQTFDIGNHTVIFRGHLTGTDDITLKASTVMPSNTSGFFIFNNQGTGNSGFSGDITLDFATPNSGVAFWNNSPFGTGHVTVARGGSLVAHGLNDITNNLTLNTAGAADALIIRSWDDKLTFSGNVTLANNVILQAMPTPNFIDFANGTGVLGQPGTPGRHPILFTGVIGESGGARTLHVQGQSIFILAPDSGPNTYTGGTVVGGATAAGTLIFGNNDALTAGSNNVTVNLRGYAGFADLSPGNFFSEVNSHVVKSSAGAIGVDTLPGNSTVTFAEDINLSAIGSGALFFTDPNARIGTATSAILTGNLTPQGTNFIFGNGGGTLYVQSNLGNTTASGTVARAVSNFNFGQFPLKLFLQGTNTYTLGTTTSSGYIIFDGANALPATGSLTAGGSMAVVGSSYIGYTDSTGLSPATFLSRFDKINTWGVVGFDTHDGNSTVNIGAINLTGFNDGVFIGTATSAILSGTISGTTVANGSNAPDTLRLTAANGGVLTVAAALVDGAGAQAVMLGLSGNANPSFGTGTILLTGANTYTGGTTINASVYGTTVVAGSNQAFGTGLVSIASTNNAFVTGLAADVGGLVLANDIAFTNFATLHLLGANAFTLAGEIAGMGNIQLQRSMTGPVGVVTLAGDNSDFVGNISLQHSTLNLDHDFAAGGGILHLFSSDAEVVFNTLAPHIAGIDAEVGDLILTSGANLTFDTWVSDTDFFFEGNITGAGGSPVNASLTIDGGFSSDNELVYLAGTNTYTGGTNVLHDGVLVLGSDQAAGTGTVTVNTFQGGLGLNSGVTFTNPLVLTQGALAGYGTFAPTSFNGVPGAPVTIGANQLVIPAIPGETQVPGGTLSFTGDMVFTDGGGYIWSLQDPTFTDGYGLVAISGNLDLSSLSPGGFTLHLQSFDANGFDGMAALTWGSTYNFTILTAAGGITGFNSNQFAFDAFDFQGGQIPSSAFSLSLAGGNSLVLNFTAVPEPSTWALLLTGGAGFGLAAWRRRRARS